MRALGQERKRANPGTNKERLSLLEDNNGCVPMPLAAPR